MVSGSVVIEHLVFVEEVGGVLPRFSIIGADGRRPQCQSAVQPNFPGVENDVWKRFYLTGDESAAIVEQTDLEDQGGVDGVGRFREILRGPRIASPKLGQPPGFLAPRTPY